MRASGFFRAARRLVRRADGQLGSGDGAGGGDRRRAVGDGAVARRVAHSATFRAPFSARAAAGWRFGGLFYAGPEVQAFASDGYSQQRIGLHVTAFKTGTLEWSAASGYARDSDHRSSAYVRFGISTTR